MTQSSSHLAVLVPLALMGCGDSTQPAADARIGSDGELNDFGVDAGAGGDGAVNDLGVDAIAELSVDGGLDPDASCASYHSEAERVPADLVFIFDRSDSMNSPSKWPPCAEALKNFFADPRTEGINASLEFFCGGGRRVQCEEHLVDWADPYVALSELPNDTDFAAAIDAQEFCSGTPTTPALSASITYARTIARPGRRVAVAS